MKNLHAALAASVCLMASLPAAAQFQKPEQAVEYRQSGMTIMGVHFGRIGAMVQGKAPFDGAAAAANADVVAFVSHLPYAGFIEGTASTKKGEAKANIWTERADFDALAKKLQDNTAHLAVVAKENNLDSLKTAFGDTAKVCKSCHDKYRNQ